MKKRHFLFFAVAGLAACSQPAPPSGDAFAGQWTRAKYDDEYLTVTLENKPALTFRQFSPARTEPEPQIGDVVDAKKVQIRSGVTVSLLADGTLLFGDVLYKK